MENTDIMANEVLLMTILIPSVLLLICFIYIVWRTQCCTEKKKKDDGTDSAGETKEVKLGDLKVDDVEIESYSESGSERGPGPSLVESGQGEVTRNPT